MRKTKQRRGFDGVTYELGPAAVYSRISGPGDTREASIDSQEKEAMERLRALGYMVTEQDVFRDRWTGKETIRRKELNRLRAACRAGIYKAVGVYKLDRLSRNQGQTYILLGEMDDLHIRPVSVLEPSIDDSKEGRLYRMLGSYMAETELANLEDRFGRGREYLLDRNLPLARGHKPYGYLFEKKPVRRFLLDSDHEGHEGTEKWAATIFARVAAGNSGHWVANYLNSLGIPPPGIAKGMNYAKRGHLGLWSANNIRRIIRNPAYKGWAIEGKYFTKGVTDAGHSIMRRADEDDWVVYDTTGAIVPALVTPEAWARANAVLDANAANRNSGGKKAHDYLLRGMIHCALCGEKLYPTRNRHGTAIYRCANHTLISQKRRPGATRCVGKHVRGPWIEPLVWGQLRDLIVTPGRLEAAIDALLAEVPRDDVAEELALAERHLSEQQQARQRMFARMQQEEAKADSDPDLVASWERAYKELRGPIESLKQAVEALRRRAEATIDPETRAAEAVGRFAEARERLLVGDDFSDEEKRGLLLLVRTRVSATGNGRRSVGLGGTGEVHFNLFGEGSEPDQFLARLSQFIAPIRIDLTAGVDDSCGIRRG